jgi:signal peptidase I
VLGLVSLVALVILVARHRVRRAWGWWIASIVALLVTAVTLWAFLVAVFLQLALWIDAIRVEVQARRERQVPAAAVPGRRNRWLHLVAMVAAGVAISVGMRVLLIEAYKIPSAGMEPTLGIGDHVMADKLALRFRDPEPGEVLVFWNPCTPKKTFIKRVVAVAGDTVELRCNQLHRNGQPVPTEALTEPCTYLDQDETGAWNEKDCRRRRERLGDRTFEVVVAATDAQGGLDFPDASYLGEDPYHCSIGERPGPAGEVIVTAPTPTSACAPQAHVVVPPGHVFVLGDNRDNSSDSRTWGPVPVDHAIGIAETIWWSNRRDGLAFDRLGAVR